MADTRRSGSGTSDPDAYPTKMPFGISVPSGTGAPGSGGAGSSSADPTLAPGQDNPGGITGSASKSDIENTGAPGSAGYPGGPGPGTVGSARYTDPGSFLEGEGGSYESMTSDQTSTQSGARYGSGPQIPGVAGNTPAGTGAGGGRVMRGGRMRGGS